MIYFGLYSAVKLLQNIREDDSRRFWAIYGQKYTKIAFLGKNSYFWLKMAIFGQKWPFFALYKAPGRGQKMDFSKNLQKSSK